MSRIVTFAALGIALACPALAFAHTAKPASPPLSATATVTQLLQEAAARHGGKPAAPQSAPPSTPPQATEGKTIKEHPVQFVFQAAPGRPAPVSRKAPLTLKAPPATRPAALAPSFPVAMPPAPAIPAAAQAPATRKALVPIHAPHEAVATDPFKGRSLQYEQLLNKYRMAQIRARIAQQRYNRMRYEKQMGQAMGGAVVATPPETAAVRRLQAQVGQLETQLEALSAQRVAQRKAVARRHGAMHLVAVVEGIHQRGAVLQWGRRTRMVHAGDVVGHFWVRAVHHHSIVLAGPHRLHILSMASSVGRVAAESGEGGLPAHAESVSATSRTSPLMELDQRLQRMAQQPTLPPP
ncbi:hypothetical protein [Acidiferrobacter sp.]|uniref:hypothetical protein n=1 Tax=Acidiferrobacter sp. TaxID=1872107 RepID=UPI00262F96B4|nr:hypothetical protein [Acidiferrobacter sp.]